MDELTRKIHNKDFFDDIRQMITEGKYIAIHLKGYK